MGKWGAVVGALGDVAVALGPRVKIGAAVFPDPRAGADQCAAGSEVFPLTQGDSPAGQLGPVAYWLLRKLSSLTPSGGTPTAATLTQLTPALSSLGTKTYVVLATDGGPNCNPSARCGADTCDYNIDGVCIPATSNCCALPGYYTGCLDATPTIQAVAAISATGIPVYVVGVPGSTPYANLLDALAVAGHTARASEPRYYDVRTADESALRSALFQIAARIAGSCSLELDAVPASPGLVNVFLDEEPLPRGTDCGDASVPAELSGAADADGWMETGDTGEARETAGPLPAEAASIADAQAEASGGSGGPADGAEDGPSEGAPGSAPEASRLDGSSAESRAQNPNCNWTIQGRTVTILGAACDRIMNGDVLDVRVVAGCPTLVR
jgi:hypothetical protein